MKMTSWRSRAATGFSLIELMVAVAIVGILASVAYPSYTNYVTRANRSAATSYLLQLANKQEQNLLDARQYSSDVAQLLAIPAEVSKNYDVTIVAAASPPTYTITATAKANQAAKDAKCGNLTYNQAGVKGISGTGAVADCW